MLVEVGRAGTATVFREENEVGGHRYITDSIGGGATIWDTSIGTTAELELILAHEKPRKAYVRGVFETVIFLGGMLIAFYFGSEYMETRMLTRIAEAMKTANVSEEARKYGIDLLEDAGVVPPQKP